MNSVAFRTSARRSGRQRCGRAGGPSGLRTGHTTAATGLRGCRSDAERWRNRRGAEGVASPLTQMLGMEIDMSEERSAGMYEVSDPTYQQVKVGKYTICRQDEKSVWIQTDDGEGGQFSDEAFFAAVDAFYRANF